MEFQKYLAVGYSMAILITFVCITFTLAFVFMVSVHNSLVAKQEKVFSSWAQVESNLQRRADLIPNLVTSIKTNMAHEQEVYTEVSTKRAGGLSEIVASLESLSARGELASFSGQIEKKLVDEAFMNTLVAEQQKVGREINKLMGVVEGYPELRSSDQFIALQAQLEGTENRINVTRMAFNDAVGKYNASLRNIPGNLVATFLKLEQKAYFKADDNAKASLAVGF